MNFSSPKRRSVRQRSGYTVSEKTTGSEAQILDTLGFNVRSSNLTLETTNEDVELIPQFDDEIGLVGFGGYIYAHRPCSLKITLKITESDSDVEIERANKNINLSAQAWHSIGLHVELEDPRSHLFVDLAGQIEIETADGPIGAISLHGVSADVVERYDSETVLDEFGADEDRTPYKKFKMKTSLYYPEIFYWEHVEPFQQGYNVVQGEADISTGRQIAVKACNRCSRFLPISLDQERNSLGYSNHCVKRAPCSHGAFSNFKVENASTLQSSEGGDGPFNLDPHLSHKVDTNNGSLYIQAHHGFQLECRPCKKFFVNAPLNPLRNSAQRREDSLRRRAIEALLRELLDRDWIFYKFRRQSRDQEFDEYIWNKFNRKCFACGKDLDSRRDMDLDHTLPLVYLWPLDESATCLCSSCNSSKHDKFPFEFERYREAGKLEELAQKVDKHGDVIRSRQKRVNPEAEAALQERIQWLFEDFLSRDDYQKIRGDKLTADLIVASIQRVLDECGSALNLVDEFVRQTGSYPESVS